MASIKSLAIFSANGHGTTSAYCSGVAEKADIAGDESESKNNSTFYPHHAIKSGFTISLTFTSEHSRNKFTEWMYAYAIKLANGTANSMQVTVPAIDFVSFGIPVGSFDKALDVGGVTEKAEVDFERMEGLTKISKPPIIPFDAVIAKFYPTGMQSGSSTSEEDLYDQKAGVLTGQLTSDFSESQEEVTSDELPAAMGPPSLPVMGPPSLPAGG